MKNITVLGWYGHGNAGDESYKTSLPLLFPGVNLSFTDKLTDQQKQWSDGFVLGGGAVIEPAFLNQLQNLSQKKYILSVTATKSAQPELLKNFESIIVRDVRSQETLSKLKVKSTIMPDCAFLLKEDKHAGYDYLRKTFANEKLDLYNKIICIVFNAHLSVINEDRFLARDEATFNKTVYELAEIIDTTPASFVFLPFGQRPPWDDRITNAWLASRCKFWRKNLVIHDRLTFQQLLNIIACSDAVISTRLHASIFSVVSGTPFVDITHHDKNLGFLETIGKTAWSIPYWHFEHTKCVSMVNEFLSSGSHREELKRIAEQQCNKIKEVISHVHLI